MTENHPITPPPELVQQWFAVWESSDNEEASFAEFAIPRAAQWGADQELEACVDWLANARNHSLSWNEATNFSANLRAARRPKPPSLKELALQALSEAVKMADDAPPEGICSDQADIIRRALEALPE
jgi:hypothetical protein